MKSSLFIAEDFYKDPLSVRRDALSGIGSQEVYETGFSGRLIGKFESIIGEPITKYGSVNDMYMKTNGTFNLFHLGQHRSRHFASSIHHDQGAYEFVGLVYLSPSAPYEAGTSFWEHKETGLFSYPSPSDARRLGYSISELVALLARDGGNRMKWNELDRVGNKFNRAVVFRAARLHSASRIFGGNNRTGRLTQTFNFSTL